MSYRKKHNGRSRLLWLKREACRSQGDRDGVQHDPTSMQCFDLRIVRGIGSAGPWTIIGTQGVMI